MILLPVTFLDSRGEDPQFTISHQRLFVPSILAGCERVGVAVFVSHECLSCAKKADVRHKDLGAEGRKEG